MRSNKEKSNNEGGKIIAPKKFRILGVPIIFSLTIIDMSNILLLFMIRL